MAKFRDARARRDANEETTLSFDLPIWKALPNLFECLCGYEEKPGLLTPGCNLSVWVDGPVVKFSINDKASEMVGFGTLDVRKPIGQALDEAIGEGTIDWRPVESLRRKR